MRRRGNSRKKELIIPQTGLVSDYSFDETTGLAIDSIGGHNGTCFNVIRPGGAVVQGKAASISGNAYEFNGTNSSVEINDNNDHSFVGATGDLPFSISLWINRNTDNTCVVLARRSTGQEWQLSITSSLFSLEMYSQGSTSNRISRGATASLQKWNHFVFRYDGSGINTGIQVFVNGSISSFPGGSSGTYVKMNNTSSTTIFGSYQKSSLFFKGLIDAPRIYKNHYLTDSEIAQLFKEGNRPEVIN